MEKKTTADSTSRAKFVLTYHFQLLSTDVLGRGGQCSGDVLLLLCLAVFFFFLNEIASTFPSSFSVNRFESQFRTSLCTVVSSRS